MCDLYGGETMGDEFADGTRPIAPSLTADEIQALRNQRLTEDARQAKLNPRGRDYPEILD